VALYRLPRARCVVAAALCWATLAVSTARGEDGTQGRIAVGTLACFDRAAVDDILAIIGDPEVEEPARRLMLILSSGECRDLLVGETYEPVAVEKSGIVRAKLRGFSKAYLLPLTANHEDISTR
jgi:hypothetical protein